jgi:DNA mismatch repair protein MutS2
MAPLEPAFAESDAPVALGTRVRVRSMGFTGEVMGLTEDMAEVAVSGKRLRVPRADVVAVLGGGAAKKERGGGVAVAVAERASTAHGAAEVNLIGLRVDEALPKLDKSLDEAALADRKEVRVIHGFGEGKLRRAVAEFLEGHPHVAQVRVGAESRGGVTVVELKE